MLRRLRTLFEHDDATGDVLLHVVQHSAYHRGQIALELRAAGGEPATTDYIHALRTGRVGRS